MFDAIGDEVESVVPRFCPRCGVAGQTVQALCAECGDRLRPQGYCAICEGFRRQEIGTECPKHDVELIAEPPRHEPFGRPGERHSLVTVATYSHPNQVNGPRIRLEAEGIPTFLDGERIAGNTLYQVATGGVRLQVPADHASASRILIAQTWSPPPEIAGVADDEWEDPEIELGHASGPGSRRRAVMKAAILVILFGPVVIVSLQWLLGFARLAGAGW